MSPLPPDLPTDDAELNDSREFSIDELEFLIAWGKAVIAGDAVAAEDIIQTGLVAEHYRSRFTLFGSAAGITPTPEQLATLDKLRIAAKAARDSSGYGR